MPVGADVQTNETGTHFRVWAPQHRVVRVALDRRRERVALTEEENGYFSGLVPAIAAGVRYKYELDGGEAYPDPASRYQPSGHMVGRKSWIQTLFHGRIARGPELD
jgi:maltooligosyltrehalose trehalohydrolase